MGGCHDGDRRQAVRSHAPDVDPPHRSRARKHHLRQTEEVFARDERVPRKVISTTPTGNQGNHVVVERDAARREVLEGRPGSEPRQRRRAFTIGTTYWCCRWQAASNDSLSPAEPKLAPERSSSARQAPNPRVRRRRRARNPRRRERHHAEGAIRQLTTVASTAIHKRGCRSVDPDQIHGVVDTIPARKVREIRAILGRRCCASTGDVSTSRPGRRALITVQQTNRNTGKLTGRPFTRRARATTASC